MSKGSQIRTLGIQVEDGSFPTSSGIDWPHQEGEYKNWLWSFEVVEFLEGFFLRWAKEKGELYIDFAEGYHFLPLSLVLLEVEHHLHALEAHRGLADSQDYPFEVKCYLETLGLLWIPQSF